jgi:hypothetical protein
MWEMAVMFEGRNSPAYTLRRCTDATTDTLVTAMASGWADDSCTKRDVQNNGGTIVIDSICTVGPVATSAHAEITGDFNQAYTLKVSTRQGGGAPAALAGDRSLTVDAKWIGPCGANHKPGDIILPGGMTMNIRNIKGLLGFLSMQR